MLLQAVALTLCHTFVKAFNLKISSRILSVVLLSVLGAGFLLNSCTHSPYVLPQNLRTGDPTICFERDVLPIFISKCGNSNCHDASAHRGGYTLDNYANIVSKGIVPGNVAASKIWETVAIIKTGEEAMPKDGAPLSASELDILRRWIETGAVDSGSACSNNPCDSNNFTYSGAIAPLMQKYCTGCHSSASAQGGSLSDYASVKNEAVSGSMIPRISHQSGYNAMPSTGFKLSDCQIAQVKKWVAAGAPNN